MSRSETNSAPPASHTVMFWFLTTMAIAAFAPCVLVPVWVKTEEIGQRERSMAGRVSDLEAQVARNDARIDALRADPLVNRRIVRRELNYRPEGEQVVRWSAGELVAVQANVPEPPEAINQPPPASPPAWLAALSRWLPAWPWHELFVRPANRSLLLLMAGGLLAAAFLLYGPPPIRFRSRSVNRTQS